MRVTYLIIGILLVQTCTHAQSKWAFGIKGSIGIQAYDRSETELNVVPVEVFGPYEQAFYTSYIQYRVGVESQYSIRPFLNVAGSLGWSNTINEPNEEGTRSQTSSGLVETTKTTDYQSSDIYILPSVQFDPLWKNKHEALLFSIGLRVGYRRHREAYSSLVDTSSMPFNEYKSTRTGLYAGAFVDLQWEEYFTDHFGYSIGIQYFLPYEFRPSSYVTESYILNGEEQSQALGKANYDSNQEDWYDGRKIRQEEFSLQDICLNIGLKYRL